MPLRKLGMSIAGLLVVTVMLPVASRAQSEEDVHASQQQKGLFRGVDEFAFESDVEYYAPQPGFDRQNRDIDVELARAALGAHFRSGWEFLIDGFAFRAHGTRTEASFAANPPQVTSSAAGLGAGPMVRWNFLQFSRVRLFLDADGSLIVVDRPFPQDGSSYDFFLRAGGGVSVRVSDSWWVESAFNFAHVSNGKGFDSANPTWQGNGVSLGLRRTFGRGTKSGEEEHGKPLFGIFGKANEGAWVSGVEYYTPLPSSHARRANFQGDVRAIRVARAWHFPNRVEFQLGGMVQKTDSAAGFGALLRWNFYEQNRLRLFGDTGGDFLQAGSPVFIIPWPGDGYTGFLRAGGGGTWRLSRFYWLEGAFRVAHVPAGFGSGASAYPEWSGRGASLSFRHAF